ncbi:MAG: hypothetical protein K9N51_07355 [Candidatus Pacebacteria bacterium]|nr:hypothetical protein [Candidatus Paceibacterota bacterium]
MAQKYGIGEIFGRSFARLSPDEVRTYSETNHRGMDCPFKGGTCSKAGGVCSLRCYTDATGETEPVPDSLVTTCPNRFYEHDLIFKWVGETLIDCDEPKVLTELPFLMANTPHGGKRAVGRIDMVLLNDKPDGTLDWCALEMQAVYFSGKSITEELKSLRSFTGPGIPFPTGTRRPDFRSSGPKRLMPQLQIKVPTITRWGKKMAVIIDREFWNSLGDISTVHDVSNCDTAWFVVDYKEQGKQFRIQRGDVFLTTLDRAVEGLTGGVPTSLHEFENTLRERL